MAWGAAARVAAEIATVHVGAILLAAGLSRRMGAANKLLLSLDGVPMVARVAAAIRAAGLPMMVVLGHEADAVRAALSGYRALAGADGSADDGAPPAFIVADKHARGIGHSLSAGMVAVPPAWTGALVCLADMPFVGADVLRRLAAALVAPDSVAVPVFAGRRGNPVAWGRDWFPRLAALKGDTGGRALLASAPAVEITADAAVLRDFDTPGDLAHWRHET